MNEQAFKDLYQEFVKTGYLGTEKDFKILMGTDSDAFNDGFSQFTTTGYNGDADAFAELIGVSNPLKKKEDSTFVTPEQNLVLDTENISSGIQPQTEQDYFEGTFGDILRGFDSVSPIGLGDFIDDMARSVAGGYNQGTVADVSSDILMRGADATEEDILKYIEANKDAQKFGPSDEMMEYLDTYKENGEGFMGVIMGLGKAGLTVIPEVLLSSITAMASSQKAVTSGLAVAGTAAAYGGAVGALAGGVGAGPGALAAGAASLPYAFAAAGATLEMGATFSELLQEEIEGELTPEKIREALNNEETYTSIRNKAIARGFTIGAIDAFTGRVGGKIAGKILSKGGKTITKAQKLKSIGAASAVEGVGGSAGEATARAVIGQDMDISEIALEGIAEVPGGIKDVISARYSKPKYKVNGKKVDASTIDDLIETMNLDQLQSTKIKIDNDYEGRDQKLQDKVLQLNTERLILEANPDINPETLAEITKLQLELSKLDGNKTEVAKEKAGVIKAKIKDLQENQLETEVETDADVFLELEQGQQIRYLDQAGKELVAEAEARGDEDFNISEEQSLARAVELFNKDQSTQGATKPKAAAKATTLNDLVNRPVTLTELGGSPLETPIEGDLYIEGQQVVIEDSDGNITEIGNVDEVLQKPLSEIGVKQDVSNISIDNDGNLNFNDKTLVPEKSGIKINKRGEISRVVLRSPDGGETVTLRGVNAEEAAYQILLKEAESMDTFPKSGQASASPKKINEILEQDEEFQNELREVEDTTETKADQDTTEVIDEKQEVAPKLEAEQKVSKDRSLKEDVRSKVNKAANGDGKGKVGFAKKWFNPIIMEIAGLETDKQIKEYYIQSLENNEPIAKINKDFYAKEFKRLGIDANLYIKKDSKAKVESAPDVTKPAPKVAPKVETEEETNTYSKRVNTLIGLNSNFREDNGEVVMGGISVKVDDLLSMTSTEFNDFIEFTKKKFKIETVNDNQSTGVKREKLSNIDTDENRFQGRAALNEDVVNNIASNWSDSDQDPIQIWKDPKNNKTYVLSGHHRFAAAKLAGKSDIKIIDRTNDFNESQAIKFATEDANANRTMETPLERANTLRKKRKKGDSKKELNDFVKREGKNKVFVENLSFLNPKGVIFQTLSRFSNNTDKQTQNKLEKIADWIGDARKRNSKLTDSHEKELFDFLNNKEQSKRFTNKTDFLSKVNSLTSEMFFDETKPLNIAKFKNKTEGEKQYDKDVSNQKEAIQKLEDKEKNIRDRFNNPNNENYINPNDSAYDSIKKRANNVLKDVEAKLKFERAKLLDIYKNKGKYNRAGINQVGMFDEQADNARKALKKLDKDIKIVIHTDDASYRKASGEESREQSTRGEYNPATKTININATKAQANTIAHEVFHALLLRNGISNKQAKAITDKMFKAVKKTASPELLARLEKFSSNYESSLQSEESIAELFGILASEYKSLDKPTQNIIQKWINKLAKLMGVKSFTDAEIIDLLNVVSAKVEAGQEITGQDVKILDSKKPKKTSKESRKQVDRVALNKMGDRFYMKKNGYMPYKSTPLGELQRDARKLGFRIETRYITEGKRRGTPTGYFIYNKKSDEGYPIMLNPRNNKEEAIKPLYKSRKQKLAPNGKPSNLDEVQYKLVRTPAFKNWFGDWETDPENASKIVDENGEPMVTYHGSAADFNVFDKKKLGSLTNTEIAKAGFFFASNKSAADQYAFIGGLQNPFLENKLTEARAFFLNIKNPYKGTNKEWNDLLNWASDGSRKYDSPTSLKKANKEFKEFLLKENFDGVDFDNGLEIVAFEPTQAKLADGTNTTFDPDAPSIRKQQVVSKSNKKILESEVSKLSLKSVIQSVRKSNPDSSVIDILTDIYKGNTIEDFNYDYLNDEVLTYDALTDVLVSEEIFNSKREAINKLSVIGKGIVFKNIEFTTQSRKQKPNYKIAKINTPNTTINVVEGAGPDSFEIATKDYKATEGAEGSTIIGFVKNKDFPGEKKKETRGEIFILQVGDKGKGTGTSLMLDALRLMKENGTKTVKFTVPSKEGKPFNESLVRKGYINLLKVSDRTGTSEYEITDKVLEDAPQSRKQKPSKKPAQKRTSSIKKAITEIKNVLKITPDEQRTIFKALNDQKKKAKEIKKDIVSSLRDLVKKGKITPSKMVSVINKVPDDFNNPTTVERFVEYMAKVFNDADYGNKMTIANSKKRRAKKNVSTKIGIADGLVQQLQRLFSVKPELIPSSVLEDYMSLINTFGQRATVLSLPDIKEVTQMTESILEQIDEEQSMAIELADRYEAAEKVYNKKTGDLDYAATIKQMLDNEVIDEREYEVMKKYKSVINPPAPATPKTEAEIEQERQDTIESIRETKEVDPSVLPSRLERDLAKKFQKLLKTDAIESLSLNDLKNLLKIIDNINNGYLPHYAQIMTGKMNAIENAKIGDQAIRRSKLLPISKIYARIKTKFTKKGAVQELIRRNPTFYIDQVFGDFRTKDIFDSIFRDSAEGSANYTKAIKEIQAKIEKAEQAVLKSFKRNPNKTLMSKYKQMSYLVQQEFLSNPDSNQVNSVEDFIKATLKRIKQETTSYTENDAKMLQEILDTYTDNGTKTFDNVALYESFNVAERNSIKTLEEINNSLTERAVYTANIIRGNKITPLKNYTHLSVIPEVGKNDIMETEASQVSDMFNKYLKPSTKAKSLIQRTGKASALNFDVYASVQRGSKYTLMDFHLTEPIRTSRRTLNQIEKNLSDENGMMPGNARIKFNAIRDASIESIENLLSNALTQSSFADQVVNDIQKQGYRAILAGAPRAAYELISNLGAVVFIDPKGFSAGVKLRKIIGSPDGKNIMTNLNSTETNRVFSTGLSGKFVDTGILNQAAGVTASKAKGRTVNTLLQLWNNTGQRWKKGVEFTADTLISSPDKLIMQPTWFGAFENRFKKITGKSPDFDKIASNDEVYMDKYASALKESTKLADSRSVLIGATDNAFMGILKGTVKPNQSVMLKAFNSFNGFMTRFLIFEYITARTGIMALVTKGTVSKKEGAALMAGVTTRMVLYTFLGTLVGETIKSLTEEEDEEDFDFSEAQYEDDSSKGIKSVEKMLGQAFVSTFTSLLFGRDLGNATKSMVNLGLEEFNEQYLQILRDGKYDKFRDAIQYTIIPEGKSGRGPKFFDIAQNLFAAFTPMLKTGVLAVNTAFDSDRKEPDAIKRQQDVRFIRLPLEILGTLGFIPLYKDVRKIVLANMYKGLRKAQAESDSNKKIKEQMLQGYNSESDMKRYDLPLWEVTFGPDSPGYDRRQAQKELKRKERKLKKLMKDELYNYSPTTKSRGRKSSPFGSGDGGKSSSPFGSSKGSGKSSSPFGG